jgi:hypothetical protein
VRLFTLEEAEALLPTLIPTLEEIRDAHKAYHDGQARLDTIEAPMRSNGHGVDPAAARRLRDEIARAGTLVQKRADELEEMGVELKDPATGLIDFRSRRGSAEIYLCWRLGEPRIDWWHELDAGFAGRKRLRRPD